jgi:hypothetical protein
MQAFSKITGIDALLDGLDFSNGEGGEAFWSSDLDATLDDVAGGSSEGLNEPLSAAALMGAAALAVPSEEVGALTSEYTPNSPHGFFKRKRSDEGAGLGAFHDTFFSAGAAADSGAEEEGAKRQSSSAWAEI